MDGRETEGLFSKQIIKYSVTYSAASKSISVHSCCYHTLEF